MSVDVDDLTQREADVLGYIIRYRRKHGYSPTTVEIMKGIDTKSMSYITYATKNLEENGYITLLKKRRRNIRLTEKSNKLIKKSLS